MAQSGPPSDYASVREDFSQDLGNVAGELWPPGASDVSADGAIRRSKGVSFKALPEVFTTGTAASDAAAAASEAAGPGPGAASRLALASGTSDRRLCVAPSDVSLLTQCSSKSIALLARTASMKNYEVMQ